MSELGSIEQKRLTGEEPFIEASRSLGFDVASFWQWSCSDLVSNATRGILAEFIVAQAMGVARGVRDEWAPFDLTAQDGTRIEVKSAAYVQSWHQDRPSPITFRVPKSRAWEASTGQLSDDAKRQADVYVFALLAHDHQPTLNPLDLCQWEFFVLPTFELDRRERSQHSIALASLRVLAGGPVSFGELRDAVGVAGRLQREAASSESNCDE